MSSKNFEDIRNLRNKVLIDIDDELASNVSLLSNLKYQALSVPLKGYSVEQVVYAVCREAEEVNMIFYSKKSQELTFFLTGLGKDFDVTALLEGIQDKGIQIYKKEAERFTMKMKEAYDSTADSLSGQISLRKFIDMLIQNYQEELKYIRNTELEWQYILRKNHVVKSMKDKQEIENVDLKNFEDGILTFEINDGEDRFFFFVPSDFEKTTVERKYSYFRHNSSSSETIQENEKALVLFSILIDKVQVLYEHCMEKKNIHFIMKNHTLPQKISYQGYQFRIAVQEQMRKVSNLSLAIEYQQVDIARVDFYFPIDRKKKKLLKRAKDQVSILLETMSPYRKYNVITSNIMLNAYLRENMIVLLEKIVIDSSICDFL